MLFLYSQPSIEPVTLTEVKNHLRIDHTEDDSWLTARITSARIAAETITRRALIDTGYKLYLDSFYDWKGWAGNRYLWTPTNPGEIELRVCPNLQAVIIYYTAPNGVHLANSILSANDDFQYDKFSEPARIMPHPGESWPETQAGEVNCVSILFVAGYGSTADLVPQPFKDYIVSKVAFQYEHRGDDPAKEPEFLNGLLDDFRWGGHC